eukprot:1232299-Prymnesium_polylepis.1
MAEPEAGDADAAGGRPRRHASSHPLGIQCQLEHLAKDAVETVVRFTARSLLVTVFAHSLSTATLHIV